MVLYCTIIVWYFTIVSVKNLIRYNIILENIFCTDILNFDIGIALELLLYALTRRISFSQTQTHRLFLTSKSSMMLSIKE